MGIPLQIRRCVHGRSPHIQLNKRGTHPPCTESPTKAS